MRQHPRQLRRHGDQEGFVLIIIAALFGLLNNQYAQHVSLVNNRHTQKTGVALFSGRFKIAELWVGLGVLEVKRLAALGHQAHQAFA